MKKLIKVSDYYYVVDDKAEIKEGDYYISYSTDPKIICAGLNPPQPNSGRASKIIATTNFLLPLPQITNASDDMVGKETSTNETLEEVAEKELKPMLCGNWNHNCFNNENLIDVWVAGYKHAESKLYSEDEVRELLLRFNNDNPGIFDCTK